MYIQPVISNQFFIPASPAGKILLTERRIHAGIGPTRPFRALRGLPDLRELNMGQDKPVPTAAECYEIIRRHNMLDNIVRHSKRVMEVSLALVDNLRDPSIVQRSLVLSAALLHDIAKTRTIGTRERHDLIGGQIMREMGYDAIAEIVESHVVFEGFDPDGALEEREIVFYADKRVMHDRIVSIDDRVDDLVKRYGINERIVKLITENKEFILRLENKLRGFLARDIEEIVSGVC